MLMVPQSRGDFAAAADSHRSVRLAHVGHRYASGELAALLNSQADILRGNEGGVTFSGGEPLLQAPFVAEVIDRLDRTHVVLDTSGYGSDDDFRLLIAKSDLVFFDLKLMDPSEHRRHTGRDKCADPAKSENARGHDRSLCRTRAVGSRRDRWR